MKWSIERHGSDLYVQVDGNDLICIEVLPGAAEDDYDHRARVTVWSGSASDAEAAWEGEVALNHDQVVRP